MQQMSLDTERATHSGTVRMQMESRSRSSHKYLLLQVWCGLLTVAVVVMAAFLTSIKPRSPEDGVSTMKPDSVSPTINTSPVGAPLKSVGSSPSFIQLIKSVTDDSWQEAPPCRSSSLALRNNSIHCQKNSLYFIYAQVTFTVHHNTSGAKSVILVRNPTVGRRKKKLVVGTFPGTTEGSVWVGKIVHLVEGDSVSLNITDDFLKDNTFWGAYQLS
ncbi:lymphotoxin-alpha [Paralichthys olivaceus]|uniref:lymphotoxin-alpha n=1 Tax=Paralichthys olivaceus TaxID=8255 RepID=UPI00375390CD